jgi:cation transport regulator ChaB
MDVQLGGFLVVAVAALPYVIEILGQVPLLTRVMSALPAEVRAELPPHPRRPKLAVFGSARFFLALFRYALRNDARDPGELVTLKRKMLASAVREAVFGMVFIVAVVVAWRYGWRPDLPWRVD